MKIAISQSNYIPWKGYFDLIAKVDVFVVYDNVQYTKNDWRNRNKIKTANGSQWLTIPVQQKSLNQSIDETKIARTNWKRKHWNSIELNYSKAPFFNKVSEEFRDYYLSCEKEYLSDINLDLIKIICKKLNIETKFIQARELDLNGDKNERLVQAIKMLEGKEYFSGTSAKDYIQPELFEQNEIKINWMDYQNYPSYPQLHPPFSHAVSVLDLLFMMGPDAIHYF